MLEVSELPPQLCKVQFGQSSLCSGFVVSKNQVLTASHCGMFNDKRGSVQCLNGQRFAFERTGVRHFDNKKIPNSTPGITTTESVKNDLALVQVQGEFNVTPLRVAPVNFYDPFLLQRLKRENDCYLFGVGLNPLGTVGLAHGIVAPLYKGMSIYNPIEFNDLTGVAPNDSGGALVCKSSNTNELVIVGVITGGVDYGHSVKSIITTFYDEKNTAWLEASLNQ